ncbi:MAG: isoprenylcysteine carboxylmethyltransferase family protein [Clostridia bacterium]|nr:isoprenylcysteine carboxylmethyltransferase family protein [Clostridia bacterium]
MTTVKKEKAVKRTFWGVAVFYFLIAFEFLYMASPFAVYFYSAYKPALDFFNRSPVLSWLVSYFLPHNVRETTSTLVNLHNKVGIILALSGFLGFCIGASQVYYHKLARKGAVTGGIYNFIRHPQYASFIICSFGLLLMWPRYIVLIMFTTMLFAYYLLAKAEEMECEEKFGQSYTDYKNKTNMFFPFKIPFAKKTPASPVSRSKKLITILCTYILTLAVVLIIAKGLNTLALNSLYAVYTGNSANISLCKIEPGKLNSILDIVNSDTRVKAIMEKVEKDRDTKYLNYVLPSEWFAAEVPMNGIKRGSGHYSPSDYDNNSFKVILTKADIRPGKSISSKEILTNVVKRHAIIEVWVDVSGQKVTKIMEMPEKIKYENIPVAVY